MIKRILAVAALPAAALAVTLGTTAASASTGPATYNNGSTEGGGYLTSQAQFRYVKDSVYLRAQSNFAALDDGVSWETHLYGTDTTTHNPVQASCWSGATRRISPPRMGLRRPSTARP